MGLKGWKGSRKELRGPQSAPTGRVLRESKTKKSWKKPIQRFQYILSTFTIRKK